MYDLSTNQQRTICTNSAEQWGADIDGNKIIWLDSRNGTYGDIYLYDLDKQKEVPIYDDLAYNPQKLRISGSRIVFLDYNGNSDVYMLELTQ